MLLCSDWLVSNAVIGFFPLSVVLQCILYPLLNCSLISLFVASQFSCLLLCFVIMGSMLKLFQKNFPCGCSEDKLFLSLKSLFDIGNVEGIS